jgi:DNA-binding CsgD family transcriptional regulator
MARSKPPTATLHAEAADPQLPDVIEAIGSESFGTELLAFLNRVCGADHCAAYQLGHDSLSEVASVSLDGSETARRRVTLYLSQQYWRRDPAISEVRQQLSRDEPAIVRLDICGLKDNDLRELIYPHIRERVMICGQRSEGAFGLSILRSDHCGAFSGGEMTRLGSIGDLLVSVLAKHASLLAQRTNPALALTSLKEIEDCIDAAVGLPRREAEVCARILYGLSSAGIALDLCIGEETVKTYRKRAFERLAIGSPRELLMWYLKLWSSSRAAIQVDARRSR